MKFLLSTILLLWTGLSFAQISFKKSFNQINSVQDEQSAVISPDGKVMYVTLANHPQNIGGKKDLGDIWFSIWMDDQWAPLIHAGNILNDTGYNAVAGFSADGNTMYLLSHYDDTKPKAGTQGISFSRKISSGWSQPENITIPYFLNRSDFLSGHISPDGSTFIFSADSYNTKGAEDIYVSFHKGAGQWTEAKNLGVSINTPLQELSPSLSEDQKTLYFSSNGRAGYGSYDVYYSQRLDDSWMNWSTPVNQGAKVNSEGRELYYRTYPQKGFALFTSTLNSDGYGDVRMAEVKKELQDSLITKVLLNSPDTVLKLVEIKRDKPLTVDDKVVRVFGKVTNVKTNSSVVAHLSFESDRVSFVNSTGEGDYSIAVPSVNEYVIKVEAPGYVGTMERLDIRTFEMKQLEMNFKLQQIEIGAIVNLKNVLFQQSTSILLAESSDELNMVADFMKTNPKVEIELAGHTDNRGLHAHNLKLSRERVEKVKAYLMDKGIDAKRITGKGYGGIKPIAENDAEETRKLNRRVEFTIVKD
jgi:OmpA-OmpF porin, OOP family